MLKDTIITERIGITYDLPGVSKITSFAYPGYKNIHLRQIVVVVAKASLAKRAQDERENEIMRRKREEKRQNDIEQKQRERTRQTARSTSDDNDLPMCRICRGSENEPTGPMRLFKPCMCDGSMQYVHVGCLQQWRQNSVNSLSYFQCQQCGFKYNIHRPRFANYLISAGHDHNHNLVHACSLLALLLATVVAGFLSRLLLDPRVIYDFINWSPPWTYLLDEHVELDSEDSWVDLMWRYLASSLDVLAFGALLIGFVVYLMLAYSKFREWYEMRNYAGIGLTVAYLSQSGNM